MKNKNLILHMFLLFILVFGVASSHALEDKWINGIWLTEELIIEEGSERKKDKENPPQISCMVFNESGEIFRYSYSKGKQKIYGQFRIVGNTLELSARNENEYKNMGVYIKPNHLLLNFRKGRKLMLRKLPNEATFNSIDLNVDLKIKYK